METALNRHTFGVEFETVLPAHLAGHAGAARRISELTGLSIIVGSRTAPTGRDSRDWRIVPDGSVRGAGTAAELVSPILQGEDGLAEVKKIADALVTIGATVNQSCGFHVHVGNLRGADIGFFRNLVKLYSKFEPVIDSLMPPSRRAGANVYCKSLTGVNLAAIDRARNLDSLIQAATGLARSNYGARFFKLNLAAFLKHSTVEFRQHAGTIDSKKAVAWIKTCLRMVVAARDGKTGAAHASAPVNLELLPTKARKVAEYVTRQDGASRREILDGTDWSALSVNRQARLAGLQIQERRVAGEVRYYAVAEQRVAGRPRLVRRATRRQRGRVGLPRATPSGANPLIPTGAGHASAPITKGPKPCRPELSECSPRLATKWSQRWLMPRKSKRTAAPSFASRWT